MRKSSFILLSVLFLMTVSNFAYVQETPTLDPPILKTAPADKAVLEGETSVYVIFEWYLLNYGERLDFQLAHDDAFTMLLRDENWSGTSNGVSLYEEGTYFWRLRRYYSSTYSEWITRSFTVKLTENSEGEEENKRLTIHITPENAGKVISDPVMPSDGYPHGTNVTLTAIANKGYKFLQWDPEGKTSTVYNFNINSDKTVAAVFEATEEEGGVSCSGCGSTTTPVEESKNFIRKYLGDWLLLGLSITSLAVMRKF